MLGDSRVRLYYYDARVYDPKYGRFLQTDPVGSKDDLDLYAYVGGDPINKTDPSGQIGCLADCPNFLKGMAQGALKAVVNTVAGMSIMGHEMNLDHKGAQAVENTRSEIVSSINSAAPSTPGNELGQRVGYSAAIIGSLLGGDGAQAKVAPIAEEAIQVTQSGVALAPGTKIPDGLVQNPYRSGSYGNMVDGKFKENLRIDPPTPQGQKGPSYSHYHKDGSGEHYSPRPGDSDPGFY